jgi:hypothetical protein
MPTIYTTGPAKVTVTERGGGGCLPWAILLAVILASGAGAADHYLSEAEHVAVDVLEVAGLGAGAAVTVAVVVLVVRAVRAYRRRHPGRAVNVVTDARWPHQVQAEAWPMLEPTRERLTAEEEARRAAHDAWADEQWRQDVKAQRWPGVPLEWSEPAGTWPDEWQQWGQR